MCLLQDATKEELLAELAQRKEAREDSGDTDVFYASVNSCAVGFDLTVSWSDGEDGSPPKGCKVLQMSWEEAAELALQFGQNVHGDTLDSVAALVQEARDRA